MEVLRKPLPTLSAGEKKIGFGYLLFQFTFLPVLLQLLGQMFSLSGNATLYNFLYFSMNFLCVLAIFSKFLKKNLLRAYCLRHQVLTVALAGFALYWLSGTLMSAATRLLFPEFVNRNDSSILSILGDHPVLLFLGTVILAPVAEEVLHRGLVFGTLFRKSPRWAYSLSALLFAAIHVVQYIGVYSGAHVAVALVQYLPAGLIFAWAYQRSGCILAPIAIHAANNCLAIMTVR